MRTLVHLCASDEPSPDVHGCLFELSCTKQFSIENLAVYLLFSNSEISSAKEFSKFSDISDYASQISLYIINYYFLLVKNKFAVYST